ncbi:two-component sensor histidine kinase [Arthrobacter sp. PGP41]|uniref:sensor histidine kinase n=1 Tax=unclassified Arthrobacter TaxID=235627 RepID=UPI000CDC85B0|nr:MULTISPECIES: ATP-binding protein [unclassified Arthrobacter]AUZ33615.1 two-component sensor histidine kinase [Arthrobacter sp. PGP41]MDT0197429.1 ATP-binding protein [Arthrobacter sp. AB6]
MLIGLVAGLIGLALGTFGVLAFRVSEKQRQLLDVDAGELALPAGAAEVLAVVGRAFVVVDAVDGVVRANPAAYAYGLVRGHTVVHKELLDMTAGVRRDGVILERKLELPRGPLGQGTIIVQVRAAMLGEEYILLLADDRTEITRTEEIRNDFVANVSHELKTPVGAISLLAEALESSADDELAVRRFAKRMHKESGRLAALVQDIIELSRLQGASVTQQGRPVDVNAVIAEAVDRSQLPAESKNIRIVVGGRTEAKVFGDQDLLVTALRNLIDNAIRYSPENTRVGIGVRSREGLVSISVTDQGEGLSPEDQERVFERFYRVDSARSRHTGGTGLGLSIVKHVASNHGGEVTLWSQPGQGSTFTLRLPEMEGQEGGEETPATATTAAGPARAGTAGSEKPTVTQVPGATGATERGAKA